jgi:hypothetical protein
VETALKIKHIYGRIEVIDLSLSGTSPSGSTPLHLFSAYPSFHPNAETLSIAMDVLERLQTQGRKIGVIYQHGDTENTETYTAERRIFSVSFVQKKRPQRRNFVP